MTIHKQLSENLLLRHTLTVRVDDDGTPDYVQFYFTFYGLIYSATITRRNIEKHCPGILAEGPRELFNSFVETIETDHWQSIQEYFKKHMEDEEALQSS